MGNTQGKEPSKPATVSKYIDEMGKEYWAFTFRQKVKANTKEHYPDLRGTIYPKVKKYRGDRVVEIEANPTYSYYKSIVSLLIYVVEHTSAKGFLCVPSKDKKKADELIECFRYLVTVIKNAPGPKKAISRIRVYTFREVQRDYREFERRKKSTGPKFEPTFYK